MNRLSVTILRVLLAMLFLGALSAQLWFIPWAAFAAADEFPELSYLAVPYVVLAILTVACVQVALIALWMLLSKVRRGAIFDGSAFGWVDAIIVSGGLATVLVLAVEVQHVGVAKLGPPGLLILLSGIVIAGLAFVLIMLVMRGLLRRATELRAELEEVV